MGLRDRLRRIQRAVEGLEDKLELEDGTVLRLGEYDRLDALIAVVDGGHHFLHDALRKVHPDASAGDHELASLIRAFDSEEESAWRR